MRKARMMSGRRRSEVAYLHQDFIRLARQLKRTRDPSEKDRLLKRMTDIWKRVDNLIVDRPTRVPPNTWDEESLARFR